MTRIGFIGAGKVGLTLAELAVGAGYDVAISNSRGPESLDTIAATLGPRARATTVKAVTRDAAFVLLAIPMRALADVPSAPFAEVILVDANNYFIERDGPIPGLVDGTISTSEYVQSHFAGARLVKAFNHIRAQHLLPDARPTGTRARRALSIAGDDVAAKLPVAEFIDRVGFDVVDLGALREGRRVQPGTPPFTPWLDSRELRGAVGVSRDPGQTGPP